jgi:hypothetical protein
MLKHLEVAEICEIKEDDVQHILAVLHEILSVTPVMTNR